MARTKQKVNSAPIKILIVDDHPVVREGLAMQIDAHPGWEVCGEADDISSALAQIASSRPDLAIVDISLKKGNGIDLITRVKAQYPSVKILVWSMYTENLYCERALQAGALGYLNKGQATRQLLRAIGVVLAGKVFVSKEFSDELLRRSVGGELEIKQPIELLSNQELEAFKLIGEGQTTLEVAASMNLSPKTVETYRARIKEKLGLRNVTEVVQRATQWLLQNK